MSKHTPGPWSVVDGHYPSMKEIAGPSFKISIVMSATDIDINEYMRRCADAQLIAAAPELLEALEYCLDCLGDEFALPADCQNNARAAIAKAKGQAK